MVSRFGEVATVKTPDFMSTRKYDEQNLRIAKSNGADMIIKHTKVHALRKALFFNDDSKYEIVAYEKLKKCNCGECEFDEEHFVDIINIHGDEPRPIFDKLEYDKFYMIDELLDKIVRPSLEAIEDRVFNYLENINYKYYQDIFGYSKWQTVKKQCLDSYYGYHGSEGGYSFTPKGLTLDNGIDTKFISVDSLKKIIEGKGYEQQSLF